jgi:glycosyltransferase involved in cell wall biosynthesis
MRVSVVVPTYNRADDVARCLESLQAQTFKDFEVLVCDDGSKDHTAQVVERYRGRLDVSYHWAENFGGPARPRNAGVQRARGEYVALLDSDDWWAPRKLEVSVRALDAGADLVYHDLWEVSSAAQRIFWRRNRTRALASPVYDDLFLNGNAIANSSAVVRRGLLEKIGGFSEDRGLIAWEDYDAWLRIAKLTECFRRLPEVLGYYWTGGGNISSPKRLIDNLRRFRELYLEGQDVPAQPAWYNYSLGLSYHRLGSHVDARSHLKRALASGLPAMQRAKAAAIVAMSSLQASRE